MANVFTRDYVWGITTFGTGHDVEEVSFGIDDKVVDDSTHAGEIADHLCGGRFLLAVMDGSAEANDAEAGIDANGEVVGTRILGQGHSEVTSEFVVTDQVIFDF